MSLFWLQISLVIFFPASIFGNKAGNIGYQKIQFEFIGPRVLQVRVPYTEDLDDLSINGNVNEQIELMKQGEFYEKLELSKDSKFWTADFERNWRKNDVFNFHLIYKINDFYVRRIYSYKVKGFNETFRFL